MSPAHTSGIHSCTRSDAVTPVVQLEDSNVLLKDVSIVRILPGPGKSNEHDIPIVFEGVQIIPVNVVSFGANVVVSFGAAEEQQSQEGVYWWGLRRWSFSVAGALLEIADDLSDLLPIRLPLLRGALGELSHDMAPHAVPCAAMLAHVTVGGPGATAVFVAGLTVPTWVQLHAVTAAIMGAGAYVMLERMPDKPDRRAQRFAAAALAVGAAMHAFQACGGLPVFFPEIANQLCAPAVVAHYVGDYISLPLLLTAYAHLAGKEPSHLLPVAALAFVGVTGFVASGTIDDSLHAFGAAVLGAAAMYQASVTLTGSVPGCADMQRLHTSQDLFIFGWLILMVARCLACGGEITELTEDKLIVLVDLLSKLGVCHLALKPQMLA